MGLHAFYMQSSHTVVTCLLTSPKILRYQLSVMAVTSKNAKLKIVITIFITLETLLLLGQESNYYAAATIYHIAEVVFV